MKEFILHGNVMAHAKFHRRRLSGTGHCSGGLCSRLTTDGEDFAEFSELRCLLRSSQYRTKQET